MDSLQTTSPAPANRLQSSPPPPTLDAHLTPDKPTITQDPVTGGTLVACQSIKAGPGCLASRHATRGATSSPWFDDSLAAVEWFPQQLAASDGGVDEAGQ